MKRIGFLRRLQRLALYLFFFSLNFETWDPFHSNGYFSVAKMAGYLYIFTLIPDLPYIINFDGIWSMLLPICIFFALLTVSGIFHMSYIDVSFFDFTIFQNIVLFFLLINHERREPRVLVKAILCFALGSFVNSVLFISGIGVQNDFGRYSVINQNQNFLGVQASISVFIVWILLLKENIFRLGRWRYSFICVILIMFYLMVGTGSRVAFISLALSCVVLIIIDKSIAKKYKVAMVGIFLTAIYAMWSYESHILVVERLMKSVLYGDLGQRQYIWESLIPVIKDNPILGIGKTGYASIKYTVPDWQAPHNVFIEVMCYTGITGLIAYLAFLIQIVRRSYQTYKTFGNVLPLILLVPVSGLLISAQMLDVKMGWCIFAYIAAVPGLYLHRKVRTGGRGAFGTAPGSNQGRLPGYSEAKRWAHLRSRSS